MAIFKDKGEYKKWILSDDWYQTIILPSGLRTPGKVQTQLREPLFDAIDFKGKSFIDIGCNSGQYCFMAKERGADKVVGVDINTKRIAQARTLAENERYDITFEEKSIFEISTSEKFDILFCIATVTEIQDFFGAIEHLKKLIGKYALIELDLARPIVYASYSRFWLRGYPKLSRRTAIAEIRQIKTGNMWVVRPSFDVLKAVFGDEFKLTKKDGGVRYDLVEVVRIAG